jgi:hypothetical protein
MLFSRCERRLMRVGTAVVALSMVLATVAMAKPRPGRQGFRLLATALAVFDANRVQCRVGSDGQICATGSSTVGGGIWPKGTADQYVFASGIAIAGIIDPGQSKSENGFAGDTAGAWFYNTSTGSGNGVEIRPIFSSTDAADVASWPAEALVPSGTDPTAALYDATLQGAVAASQGDNWFISWEGDPSNLTSRTHPMGILVETRSLAWNFPTGNEDILYFVYTFYNITSTNPADYAYVRPELQPVLVEAANNFHALNTAKYGINLPTGGYSINDLFVALMADMDVANADANFASVNVPFALGYTYEHSFSEADARSQGWTFDPAIFGSAPFFAGPGFVGTKYLRSPIDPATGQEVGLTMFGTFSRASGALQDPNDDRQLYRYISGDLLPADGACSVANPRLAHICFVNIGSAADMRTFQSSGPFNLGPGQSGSVVVAYIFAAPVAAGGCPGAGCADVRPANSNTNLTILGSAARMASGVNKIDTIAGYLGFDDANGDGIVTQAEFRVRPGSLLGKALVAQTVFDKRFLLPSAPTAPNFFLVPGDRQVSILWARSETETVPDPFFAVASSPTTTITDPVTGQPVVVANPAYDPNFRGLDVEGYRVYRGRTNNPSELTLIAQFDYAADPDGHGVFHDFRATMNPVPGCAPELGVVTECPITFSTPPPGEPFVGSVPVDLVGTVTQVIPGNRVLLATGAAQTLPGLLDTAFVDIAQGRVAQGVSTELSNTGVPFLYVDHNVRNSLRYFYAVTAFDVNSTASGPSSLESARNAKAVTPVASVSNDNTSSSEIAQLVGRDQVLPLGGPLPSIDPARGTFSGPFPPAGGATARLGALVTQVLGEEGALFARLDSIQLGSAYTGVPHTYWFTGGAPGSASTTTFTIPILQPEEIGVTGGQASFSAAPVDPARAARLGAGGNTSGFLLPGQVNFSLPGPDYLTLYGRGCVNARDGFGDAAACAYNGSRWFEGPSPDNNETQDDPIACNTGNFTGAPMPCHNNAGALPGVTTIYQTQCYQSAGGGGCREMTGITSGAKRAADFNLYWGAGGVIDSVIDVTHNVVVPFDTLAGGTWGILNPGAATAVSPDSSATLTNLDFACVEPFRTHQAGSFLCPEGTALYQLSNAAVPGAVGFFSGGAYPPAVPIVAATSPGFALYIAGDMFTIELTGGALPADGTVWSLRQYVGAIVGGQGAGGDLGPYRFSNPEGVLPFTAVGAELRASFSVQNQIRAATKNDLSGVHTVPDPYYARSKYEVATEQKVLKFVGLPQDAIIRIYSASGVLVRMLEHHAASYSPTSITQGSEIDWDLRNRNNQVVASGVYFYHVEAGDARRVGRFTVVNFAQ